MRLLSSCRNLLFIIVLLPLMSGCVRDSASYQINSDQALTLIRNKPYFWSSEFKRTVTVMSLPGCLRRYQIPADGGQAGNVKVFRTVGGEYVLQDGLGQYRMKMTNCNMAIEGRMSIAGELVGAFEEAPESGIRFVPMSGGPAK